jgi:hypothetical protein
MRDSQLTELSGRHLLIAQLVAGGLEVAVPVRDRGVDLIAYLDLSAETKRFVSCPIQMKASQEARFGLDRKYEKIAGLLNYAPALITPYYGVPFPIMASPSLHYPCVPPCSQKFPRMP